jgi:hypothetical protein
MRFIAVTIALALSVAVVPAEAKPKNKIKTVVGCVEGTPNHYELTTKTKKGKAREYTLVGTRDFASEVGHRVRVQGAVSKGNMKVSSLKDLASTCQ